MSNFSFISKYDTRVAHLARQAEDYVYSDPESCLFKLRLIVETMARRMIEREAPNMASSDLGSMLGALQRSGTLPPRRADAMHAVRRDGNAAVHGDPTPSPTAMRRLRDVHRLSGWYVTIVRRGTKVKLCEFEPPAKPESVDGKVLAAAERLEDEIEARRHATRAMPCSCSGPTRTSSGRRGACIASWRPWTAWQRRRASRSSTRTRWCC